MQETVIDAHELDQLAEKLKAAPEVLSWARREAMIHAAAELKSILDSQIGGTGRVKSWQQACVGSFGGYAAVRPRNWTWIETRQAKRYAVGYITNAINSGHWKRGRGLYQDKRLRGYQTGSSTDRVEGKHFYENARELAEPVAQEAAEEIAAALMEHLEG